MLEFVSRWVIVASKLAPSETVAEEVGGGKGKSTYGLHGRSH